MVNIYYVQYCPKSLDPHVADNWRAAFFDNKDDTNFFIDNLHKIAIYSTHGIFGVNGNAWREMKDKGI